MLGEKKYKFVSSPVCAAIVVSIHVYVLCVLNPIRDRPTLDIKRINFIGWLNASVYILRQFFLLARFLFFLQFAKIGKTRPNIFDFRSFSNRTLDSLMWLFIDFDRRVNEKFDG